MTDVWVPPWRDLDHHCGHCREGWMCAEHPTIRWPHGACPNGVPCKRLLLSEYDRARRLRLKVLAA